MLKTLPRYPSGAFAADLPPSPVGRTSTGSNRLPADIPRSQLGHDYETDRPVVLNVEDFEPSRYLRSRVLRDAGFDIVPDLALVDVDLPDGDGFNVCETVKHTHPELPVLLVSAVHVSASAAHRGRLTGAGAFLREPIAPDVLVSRVMDALEGIRDEASLNWVVTDSAGVILEASGDAEHMMGFKAAGLRGRSLLTFFDGERTEWSKALVLAHAGQVVERVGRLRPRDRRPLMVTATVAQAVDYPIAATVLWTFRPPLRTPHTGQSTPEGSGIGKTSVCRRYNARPARRSPRNCESTSS